MTLCEKYTKLVVRTNADTPHDAAIARSFGAVGIGLCRTEHMFFETEKIKAMPANAQPFSVNSVSGVYLPSQSTTLPIN